jgi:NAD(P)-dependent dehydrogenase (short-subunit alcohol dehydrogenase family)
MNRLTGKSALIIGASTGIGRAVCELFAAEGAAIAIADRGHAEEKRTLLESVAVHGHGATILECDVLNEADLKEAVAATIAQFGKLDILVNNAGVSGGRQDMAEQDWTVWDSVIDVNLRGVAYGMHHALPHMVSRGYGRIINTASQLAHKPGPRCAAYCASKAGVVALTVSVAQEVADKGVTVNCVCPGPADTAMWRGADPAWNAWKLEQLPLKRVGTPTEIAWSYVYLASDEAAYMIGQSVSPNGGDIMW